MKVRHARRAVRDRLAVQDDLVTGRAIIAARMAMKSALQFRPFRLHSRTSSPSFNATILKPSCFTRECQPSPAGTSVASTGRAGRMKPGGGAGPEREANAST